MSERQTIEEHGELTERLRALRERLDEFRGRL
jgi:hypothetical protein